MVSTLLNGLVSYWKLDTNNATQPDEVGGNDGTVTGATFTASGKIGGAYSFDGVNDYISIVPSPVDFSLTSYTIGMWIYRDVDSSGFERLLSKGIFGTAQADIFLQISNLDKIQFGWQNSGYTNNIYALGNTSIPVNTWTHVVGIFDDDSNTFKIYVNGVDDTGATTGTTSSARANGRNGLLFCHYPTTYYGFNGLLDETAIWNRALTTNEITELYNDGEGNQYPFTTDTDNAIFNSHDF